MYTKVEQLKKNKPTKEKSFGSKKYMFKKKTNNPPEREVEKSFLSWLHNSSQKCIICGDNKIEVHHVTDIKKIKNEPRRKWNRVVCLCAEHHRIGANAIHVLSKDDFYKNIISFGDLMDRSRDIYKSYLRGKDVE